MVVAAGGYERRRREAYAFTTIYNCIMHDSEIARMFVIVNAQRQGCKNSSKKVINSNYCILAKQVTNYRVKLRYY